MTSIAEDCSEEATNPEPEAEGGVPQGDATSECGRWQDIQLEYKWWDRKDLRYQHHKVYISKDEVQIRENFINLCMLGQVYLQYTALPSTYSIARLISKPP